MPIPYPVGTKGFDHLETAGPDTGVFVLNEVRPDNPQNANKGGSRTISYPKGRYSEVPDMVCGFRGLSAKKGELHLDTSATDKSTTEFRIAISEEGSNIYGGAVTWIETKKLSKECEMGYTFMDARDNGSVNVAFKKTFDERPEMINWLNNLHLGYDPRGRSAGAWSNYSNLTNKGFTMHMSQRNGTPFQRGTVAWVAWPKNKKKKTFQQSIEHGQFDWGRALDNYGHKTFPEGMFNKPPTVLAAFSVLAIVNGTDWNVMLDITNVTQTGYDWSIKTWAGCAIDVAVVDVVAFDHV